MNWKFRVRWAGYEPDEDSWLNGNAERWLFWTLIVKKILNANRVEDYATNNWEREISEKEDLTFTSFARLWIHSATTRFLTSEGV